MSQTAVSVGKGLQKGNHRQGVSRIRKKRIIDNELIFRSNLKIISWFCLTVVHGILLHSHKSGLFVCLGIRVAVLKIVQMVIVFLKLISMCFQFFQLLAFLSQRRFLLFRGWF